MKYNQKYDIPGWFGFQNFYQQAIDDLPQTSCVVEVGVLFGASSAFLVDAIEAAGKEAEVFLVDLFDDRIRSDAVRTLSAPHGNARDAFEYFAKRANLYGRPGVKVHVHEEDSIAFAQRLTPNSLDFVFLDGGHVYRQVRTELQIYTPAVRPGGVIAGHDYGDDRFGVSKAVDEFFGKDVTAQPNRCWRYQRPSL